MNGREGRERSVCVLGGVIKMYEKRIYFQQAKKKLKRSNRIKQL